MGLAEIWDGLFTKKVKHIQLNPESLNDANINQAVLNQLAELRAENQKLKILQLDKREAEEDKKEENIAKKSLIDKKRQIEKEEGLSYLSLRNFFHKYHFNKEFRDKLSFSSFDRGHKFGKFKDMGISHDGDFVLVLEDGSPRGRVLLKLDNPKKIFQSTSALVNDLDANIIPLNLNKDGEWIENIMGYWEAPKLIPDSEGKFKYSKASKQYLYDFLAEKQKDMSALFLSIKELEETNIKLNDELNSYKRANKMLEHQASNSQKELSKNTDYLTATNKVFHGVVSELAKMRDVHIMAEDKIDALESALKEMTEKAQREGLELSDEKAMDLIRRLRRELTQSQMMLSPIENVSSTPKT